MVIKYKNYIGALIYANQIEKDIFEFVLEDINDIKISFQTSINDIRIVKCLGNEQILSELNIKN